jgi:5-(carboxyamino)imidazole ribonucleotide synthase
MSAPLRVPPGGAIGIIGGGQLGRMTALAAADLGYRCHVFTPEADSPASQVAWRTTQAAYDDSQALEAFAKAIDVATFEFENIPLATVERLARLVPVRPGAKALAAAQDRLAEKTFFNELGIATAPWRAVRSLADLEEATRALGTPAILKTARLGYDGKGQAKIEAGTDGGLAWQRLATDAAVLEGYVDFDLEISAIVARGQDGALAAFDVAHNVHRDHILATSAVPAPIAPALRSQAVEIASRAARALDLVGLLAVEMFVDKQGRLLVNEMAPRPHNSGHWTIDACRTSQFEQLVRAICGLPLGSPVRLADATMTNLIGAAVAEGAAALAEPDAKLHLYGKTEIRGGRKMGHVTRLQPLSVD